MSSYHSSFTYLGHNSSEDYDLMVLSNSNFTDNNNMEIIKLIKENKDKKIIAFGDSNILLSKAFELEYKLLDLGHKGTNIPVKNLKTEKNHITGQNHLYYIPKQENISVLYNNIHDNTPEAYISNDNSFAGFFFKPSKETFIKILNTMGVN